MELRHLEYFVAVAEERHFTRAARRLMVSQSGLSASIRSLEKELGAALFVRSTRSVRLTGAGQALFGEACRALASVRAARDAVAAVQGLLRGRLSVGTEQCVSGAHVPSLLARFRAEHPEVEVLLRQAGSRELVGEVAAGRMDLAFVALCGEAPDGVRLLPLASEPMVLLCHPGHPLAAARRRSGVPDGGVAGGVAGGELAAGPPVRWDELAGEPFVDFQPDWGARGLTDRAFATAGVQRRVALEVNDVHSLLELVGHGLGIAVVPHQIARKEQASELCTVALPADGPGRWRVSMAVPDEDATGPAARELLRYLVPGTPA
jgi:DNA-binding transcriptional LysR family regulator